MFEILRDGAPISELFFSEEQAAEWISERKDLAEYTVRPFDTGKAAAAPGW